MKLKFNNLCMHDLYKEKIIEIEKRGMMRRTYKKQREVREEHTKSKTLHRCCTTSLNYIGG